jgi:hypothetical protein
VNRDLRSLLSALGVASASAVMLYNKTAIPRRGGSVSERGFRLLLLDDGGSVRFFCKCAPAEARGLARDVEVVSCFSADPSLAGRLVLMHSGTASGIRVAATRFTSEGDWFQSGRLRRMATAEWFRLMSEILLHMDHIADRAGSLLTPSERADAQLDHDRWFASFGLEGDMVVALRAMLTRALSLPFRAQHGDLWASNILGTLEDWRIIDFESYGDVQVPLYDACHLVRTGNDIRQHDGLVTTWLERMKRGDAESAAGRSLLRSAAERAGLASEMRVAAACHYVVDFAARIAKRDGPAVTQRRFAAEVRAFGKALLTNEPLDDILFG